MTRDPVTLMVSDVNTQAAEVSGSHRPGQHLRAWRRRRGLTQAQLAMAIGVDRTYLAKLETGQRPCQERLLARAARALDCRAEDLTDRPPDSAERLEAFVAGLSTDERERALVLLRHLFGPRRG